MVEFIIIVLILDVVMISYGSMFVVIKGELLVLSSILFVEKVIIECIEESVVIVNDMVLIIDVIFEDDGVLVNFGMNYIVSFVMVDDFEVSLLEFGFEFNCLDIDFIKVY